MQLPHNIGKSEDTTPNLYAASQPEGDPDFSEFMWMANEDLEAFDQKVISELDETLGIPSINATPVPDEEEQFLHSMLAEEEERDTVYFEMNENGSVGALSHQMGELGVSTSIVTESSLNPLAAEFVPSFGNEEVSFSTPQAIALEPQRDLVSQMVPVQIYPTNGTQMPMEEQIPESLTPTPGLLPQPAASIVAQVPDCLPVMGTNAVALNGVPRPPFNGQPPVVPNFYNAPVFVQGMPMYPMMNGSQFIRPPTQFFNVDVDRGVNDDEGYGDN